MSDPTTPMERFKHFVSELLTVTKDDIRKVEDTATDIVPKRGPAWDEEEA